jgi:hypothetical protein
MKNKLAKGLSLNTVFGDSPKNEQQKRLWLITSFVFAVFFIFSGFIFFSYKNLMYGRLNFARSDAVKREAAKNDACLDCVRRNLDGEYVKPGEENLYPIAVIIENLLEARPQSGLSQASLVYEAEAEGNITRFLAFFDGGVNLEKIGPVRSARSYFIDWAVELSALFVHCGGSPQALAQIASENIFALNEFYQGDFFWRDKARPAPHNIYTSSENLEKYLELKGVREGKFLPWQFKDDAPMAGRPEKGEIEVNFPLADYVVKWQYNKENNDYTRYTAGQTHKDADGREIKARNVIIEYVGAQVIDEELRLEMEHIGSGQAIVCLDGKCEEGEWQKKSSVARTRFYKITNPPLDKGGVGGFNTEEFKLNAGATWIEVVRPEYEVSY